MKSVICAIIKNEQLFIREWVEYNLNMGFNKLYIYEDYGSDTHYNELADYIKDGKVELVSIEKDKMPFTKVGCGGADISTQGQLYRWFLNRCKTKELDVDWLAFFDIDEFIAFEDGYDLERLEQEFDDTPGVLLCWVLYGANGNITRPKGNVVDNYKTHMPLGTLVDKGGPCINTKSLINIKNNETYGCLHHIEGCIRTDRKSGVNDPLNFEKAWINHYFTKSWEDYLDRIFSRGNMQNNYRCLDGFFRCNPELLPKKEEMIMAQRHRHTASTMWISRDFKVISGGNEKRLNELRLKYIQNK